MTVEVLIVDDEWGAPLAAYLTKQGLNAVAAKNFSNAAELLQADDSTLRVVILDYHLDQEPFACGFGSRRNGSVLAETITFNEWPVIIVPFSSSSDNWLPDEFSGKPVQKLAGVGSELKESVVSELRAERHGDALTTLKQLVQQALTLNKAAP